MTGEATDVVVLFADVSGSTKLYETVGDAEALKAIGSCLALVRIACEGQGGRVVKTIGDEVMFSGVSAQVAHIAIALREAAHAQGLPPVHAGIAAGMVVARDGDFYGPIVNLASRLTGVAPPGAIYASDALRAELAGDPSFAWSAVGRLDLRSIGPVPVFALQETLN